MTKLLKKVERRWRKGRHGHGPPASAVDIATFESRYGVRSPVLLRAYFATLNGSEVGSDGPMDAHHLAFWHLAEVPPVAEECPSLFPDAPPYFIFADYSVCGQAGPRDWPRPACSAWSTSHHPSPSRSGR